MYPTLSDLLADLFGINLPLPIQTFGFFVGIAFLVGIFFGTGELRRKMQAGLIPLKKKMIREGGPMKTGDLLLYAFLSAFAGYKLLVMITNYQELVANPQAMILSLHGNPIGALAGLLSFGLWYWVYRKNLPEKTTEHSIDAPDLMGTITMYAFVGGLIGAKLFHNLENPQEFLSDPLDALLSFSGLTMYGGLILASFLIYRFCKREGYSFKVFADAMAPTLMISYAVGRIGCHVSGDGDWGISNTSPKPSFLSWIPDWAWAYRYPNNVINDGIPIPGCVGNHCYMLPEPVFPTPFYETLMCLLLFGVLWTTRKRFAIPGTFFAFYLVLNGLERFLIESIRVNSLYHIGSFSFTQAQLISSMLFFGGAAYWYFQIKKSHEGSPAT